MCKSINALKPPARAGSHQKSRWCKASSPGITTGQNASLTRLSLCAMGAPPACASPTRTLRYPLLPSASRPPPVQLPSHRKHPNHCWLHCLGVRDMPQSNSSLFFCYRSAHPVPHYLLGRLGIGPVGCFQKAAPYQW